MTSGERLQQISGLSGVTAAVMLLAIGSGATTGDALRDYSGLSSGTAEQMLLVDVARSSAGGNLTGTGYAPSTVGERRALQKRLDADKALLQAADVVVESIKAFKPDAEEQARELSAQLQQRLAEIRAEQQFEQAYRDALDEFAARSLIAQIEENIRIMETRQQLILATIEEIDVVFVMFVLAATDHDDRGSG